MRFCPSCGQDLAGVDAHFCPNCGARLVEAVMDVSARRDGMDAEASAGPPDRRRLALSAAGGILALLVLVAGLLTWRTVALRAGASIVKKQAAEAALVPDLRGLTAGQASDQVKHAGLVVGRLDYDKDATGAPGAVVDQDPAPGSRVRPQSLVVVTVAGAAPVSVPNMLKLDRSGAQSAAAAVGLNVIIVEEESPAKAGTVLSQQPKSGATVPPGSSVNVWVAKASPSSSSGGSSGDSSDQSDGTYTPKRGSAERTAIMDACRVYFSYNGKFLVDEMKVRRSRAYATVTPQDYPGYGSVNVYLLKNGDGWIVSTDSRSRGSSISETDWLYNR